MGEAENKIVKQEIWEEIGDMAVDSKCDNGISVIVPFLNEEDGIELFCTSLEEYAQKVEFPIELIFVDDGSTDHTCEILCKYEFKYIAGKKLVRLSKNCGSHAAIRAGLQYAGYGICTWMGSDCQEPVEFLEKSYELIQGGYEAVYIEKRSIAISHVDRGFSRFYSKLMRKYAVKNYASGGISNIVFNEKIKNYINENIEANSSIMLQIIDIGFSYTILPMDYRERAAGESKWTLAKKVKIFIDSFVSFSFMPIRLVSLVGIAMFVGGGIFGLIVIINKLLHPEIEFMGYATLASLISIGFGITNISLGIIAEYLWRAYDAARKRPIYIVSDVIDL